jgi:hypothetical protein
MSESSNIPANLSSIVRDFTLDLTNTFPEYSFLWKKWLNPPEKDLDDLFTHFTRVFPERFFDILYQNNDIFLPDNETNTAFLPNVDFKLLFNCTDITETTRKAIWKYLQLILMSILKSVQDKVKFGDAANMFEGVDETVLQDKLSETMAEIGNFFKGLGTKEDSSVGENPFSEEFFENMAKDMPNAEDYKRTFDFQDASGFMPNAEELHEHLKGIFDGKIGSLAKELAEEISKDVENLFGDGEGADVHTTQDLLKKMMKNPKKIMDLMKTIGGKIQEKMKSGDLTEEEIMKEAGELMGKMKEMGGKNGMGDFGEMFKNLAKGMGGGKAKFNTGAFQKMSRQMEAKDRMRQKLEEKRGALKPTEDPNRLVFQLPGEEDTNERSSIRSAPSTAPLPDSELEALFQKEDASKKTKKHKSKKTK